MGVRTERLLDAPISVSQEIGVGGVSSHARQTDPNSAAERALTAYRQWRHRAATMTPSQLAEFPFQPLVGYYRGAGRLSVADDLVSELRQLHDVLAEDEAGLDSSAPRSLLAHWLPLAVDQKNGDYHTYIGTALYERHWGRATRLRTETESRDAVIVALAADLLATETHALMHTASRHQYARTRAAFQLLKQSAALAPTMRQVVADAAADAPMVANREDGMVLATTGMDLAKDMLARTSDAARQLVDITMLPVTQLHDEQMFIRCIQLFEGLYVQVVRSLECAIAALEDDDAGEAEGLLRDAATRVEAMPILFRVLTTMPQDAFAVIRDHTHGRSAIQSRAYRRVELLSAPREAGSSHGQETRRNVASLTFQEVYLKQAECRMTAAQADGLAQVMRRLDLAWRTSKRTHWGITLKVIGSVPGTGGTSGADYLKHAAGISLFPSLDADAATGAASQ